MRSNTTLSTLQTQNGTYTSDIVSTMEHMMDYFIPEDSVSSDNAHHKRIIHEIEDPLDTPDDEEFTKEEILAVIEKFDPGKAPGEDGLNSEILMKIFKQFPTFLTGIYNVCLRKGYFPKQWKHSIIIPIVKPGKEGSTEVTKYRLISLLHVVNMYLTFCLNSKFKPVRVLLDELPRNFMCSAEHRSLALITLAE